MAAISSSVFSVVSVAEVPGDGGREVMIGAEANMDGTPCDDIIDDLNALEQAIVGICSPDVVREIQERKRMIRAR